MKTFQEFITEARQQTFSSRADLERHYGGVPKGMVANNAASKENPSWRLVSAANRKAQAKRRKERLSTVTGANLTDAQKNQAQKKEKLAAERGKELHHVTPTEESDKIRRSMTLSQWQQRLKSDEKQGIYHGNHPRNLSLANPTHEPISNPGLHHSDYHAFERRNRRKLADISNAISTKDAYRILNNKRKRQRKEKEAT